MTTVTAPYKQHNESALLVFLGFLTFNVIFGLIIGLTLFLLVGPFYDIRILYYITLPYYSYTLTIGRYELWDGAHWRYFSEHFPLLRSMRAYFELKIAQPVPKEFLRLEKQPGAQVILATFPHGAYADYRLCLDGIWHQVMPNLAENLRTLAATVLFRLPIVREWGLWTGCVDARRSVAEQLLDRGRSFLVVPGGEAEQIRTERGREIVFLQNRKGFIKLALRKNVAVVPIYVFGASDMYHTSPCFFGFREMLQKKLGVGIPLTTGLFGWMFCPLPQKITVVLGKPMTWKLAEKGNPTQAELDSAHSEFCKALIDLFEEHKEALGFGDRKLEMI